MLNIVKHYWHSPGAMTAFSVIARALAMALPLPVLYAHFDTTVVSFWLLIITFQSIIGALSGSLPTISMQMLSYAFAGSNRLTGSAAEHSMTNQNGPNQVLMARVNRQLRIVFLILSGMWLLMAITGGTAIVYGSLSILPNVDHGWIMWTTFIILSVLRLLVQPLMAFLFAVGETASARRAEAFTWLVGALLTPLVLWLTHNPVFGLLSLYSPFVVQYFLVQHWAKQKGFKRAPAKIPDDKDQPILSLVWERAWRGSIGTFAGMFTLYGGGFIFAQYATAADLAAFLLALNILGFIQQFAMSPLYGAMPAMAASYASGNEDKLLGLADRIIFKSSWLTALLLAPVPLAFVFLDVIGTDIGFVPVKIWLLLAIATMIARYGATHLHLFAVSNEIKLHIANGLFACLYLIPLLLLDRPSLTQFATIQIGAAIPYAFYARSLTFDTYGYALRRDIWAIVFPIGGVILLVALQIHWLK
ncbi:hypothetical protein [Parasphingorhabdus sp.]|uniref:hypothetical protein n=1 Tax=Parasphingorhabdus sp. TaxID=2709688 RepID=UPI00300380D6